MAGFANKNRIKQWKTQKKTQSAGKDKTNEARFFNFYSATLSPLFPIQVSIMSANEKAWFLIVIFNVEFSNFIL